MTLPPSRVYLSAPEVSARERELVLAAIDSGWVAPVGPDLDAFEAELARWAGTRFAVALSSGTAALHLALHAHGVGAGDEVLVSDLTFVATANAVLYTGATPVFVDCEQRSWNLDPALVIDELDARARTGRLPRAVVGVDLYGEPADWEPIVARCRELGVLVVEDAAEALGARHGDRPCGSLGDVGVLSFNGNKIVTTSGGGALVCDDEALAQRARYLSTQARQPVVHYEHVEMGFNYRLSNLLAALGRAQLEDLPAKLVRRASVHDWYEELFGEVPGVALSPRAPWGRGNHWLTCITIDPAEAGFAAADLMGRLEAADIESRPTWKPLHLQPQFREATVLGGGVAEGVFATGLCLPSGRAVLEREVRERIVEALALPVAPLVP